MSKRLIGWLDEIVYATQSGNTKWKIAIYSASFGSIPHVLPMPETATITEYKRTPTIDNIDRAETRRSKPGGSTDGLFLNRGDHSLTFIPGLIVEKSCRLTIVRV